MSKGRSQVRPSCSYSILSFELPQPTKPKGNTNGISPSNLEYGTESRLRPIDEGGLRSNSRITAPAIRLQSRFHTSYRWLSLHVGKCSSGSCKHLTKPSWPRVFEIELSLGNRLWRNNMACGMSLDSICDTNLYVMRMETGQIMTGCMTILSYVV